ncbi:hypothetical protein BJ508DRAFT_362114 [Ascobolus immersus RN42]|uniref:MYND-type domain-containing protein n=1 Tax=Ascobolus immersus RN42 TaxID=1160509 RepID=A0A3N4I8Y3_ASCIM|nr:hypothetical protein BJ508DRAFT_362114 [Ascobolus immersus RN42]
MTLPTYTHSGKTVWVKLHPKDTLKGLNPVFLTNPETHIAQVDPKTSFMAEWGITHNREKQPTGFSQKTEKTIKPAFVFEIKNSKGKSRKTKPTHEYDLDDVEDNHAADVMARMQVQHLYYNAATPEEQWIKHLAKAKEASLNSKENQQLVRDRQKQDYVVKICLEDLKNQQGEKFCYRIVQVSGGLPLNVFVDKVLLPVMGWSRNYHAYYFIDQHDGTVYGPSRSGFVDVKHQALRGVVWLDDEKYTLAHILKDKDSSLLFNYDLGDMWRHSITIASIHPASSSTSKITLLSGSGACPPEDRNLDPSWQDRYNILMGNRHTRAYNNLQHEIHSSMNYKDLPENHTLLGRGIPWQYDPHHFDLELFQQKLSDAVASRLSDKTGPKKFVANPYDIMAFQQGKRSGFMGLVPGMTMPPYEGSGKGSRLVQELQEDGIWYLCERVRSGEEPMLLCGACGKPEVVAEPELMKCGRCKGIWYCGKECQKGHWKVHKKVCVPGKTGKR